MFLLRGIGQYTSTGKTYKLVAPCVFVHIPGIRTKSGPTTLWDELYLSYAPSAMCYFMHTQILCKDRLSWAIVDLPAIEKTIMNLKNCLAHANDQGMPDMIDWLCLTLILQTKIPAKSVATLPPAEAAVYAIRDFIEQHYHEEINLAALIREHGLSESHFRRLWSKHFTCPPAHYITVLRIGEACRLLADQRLRITEIAEKVGYKDVFHFSKRFRQITGQSASIFRQQYKGDWRK